MYCKIICVAYIGCNQEKYVPQEIPYSLVQIMIYVRTQCRGLGYNDIVLIQYNMEDNSLIEFLDQSHNLYT